MTQFLWERSPFFSNPGLLDKNIETNLQFSLSALSRLGAKHEKYGMNNQDAIHLSLLPDLHIGILCDGTSSTSPQFERIFSNNEVGANLFSYMVGELCKDISKSWQGPYSVSFVKHLDRCFKKRYRQLLLAICAGKKASRTASHFTTTTCLGYIIHKDEYLVFGAGDGYFILNGIVTRLEGLPFVSFLSINEKAPVLNLIAKGQTKDLHQLALLSDGFASHGMIEHPSLMTFLERSESQNGFQDKSAEFHLEVLNEFFKKHNDRWPQDDASCILLKRVKNGKK